MPRTKTTPLWWVTASGKLWHTEILTAKTHFSPPILILPLHLLVMLQGADKYAERIQELHTAEAQIKAGDEALARGDYASALGTYSEAVKVLSSWLCDHLHSFSAGACAVDFAHLPPCLDLYRSGRDKFSRASHGASQSVHVLGTVWRGGGRYYVSRGCNICMYWGALLLRPTLLLFLFVCRRATKLKSANTEAYHLLSKLFFAVSR
jgi:hypothetical protein